MNVSLTPELEKFIAKKVKSGLYQTSSEVVREALRYLQEREKHREQKIDELREMLRPAWEASERGETTPWNKGEFLKEARKRRAASKEEAHAKRD